MKVKEKMHEAHRGREIRSRREERGARKNIVV
jgi:hypothetical protein